MIVNGGESMNLAMHIVVIISIGVDVLTKTSLFHDLPPFI